MWDCLGGLFCFEVSVLFQLSPFLRFGFSFKSLRGARRARRHGTQDASFDAPGSFAGAGEAPQHTLPDDRQRFGRVPYLFSPRLLSRFPL